MVSILHILTHLIIKKAPWILSSTLLIFDIVESRCDYFIFAAHSLTVRLFYEFF